MDNTVNDMRSKIKFESIQNVRNFAFLFWIKIYFIFGEVFFKIPKNLNIDMPRQKTQILHW